MYPGQEHSSESQESNGKDGFWDSGECYWPQKLSEISKKFFTIPGIIMDCSPMNEIRASPTGTDVLCIASVRTFSKSAISWLQSRLIQSISTKVDL